MIITKRAMMIPRQFLWLGFADTSWCVEEKEKREREEKWENL